MRRHLLTLFSVGSAIGLAACNRAPREDTSTLVLDEAPASALAPPPMAPAPVRTRVAERSESAVGFANSEEASLKQIPSTMPGSTATEYSETLIIRNGNASIEVDSLDLAVARVRGLATALGGYISNTTMQAGRHQVRSATVEVKIPSPRFDDAVSGLSPIGRLQNVNVSAVDVSEEFVDLAARVENARRLERRLVELLATRTGRLQDVLSVERELARVREEIERMEGRMRYLRTRSSLSTLAITVHEPHPIVGTAGGGGVIGEAFREAWRNVVHVVAWMIAAAGALAPFALVALIIGLAGQRFGWWRRRPDAPPAGATGM